MAALLTRSTAVRFTFRTSTISGSISKLRARRRLRSRHRASSTPITVLLLITNDWSRFARITRKGMLSRRARSSRSIAIDPVRAMCSWPGRIFIPTRLSALTASRWRGFSGTTPTCRGTAPNCGARGSTRMAAWVRVRESPAARASRFFNRNGRPTAPSTSFPIAAAGGISIGRVAPRLNLCMSWKRSSANRSGRSRW